MSIKNHEPEEDDFWQKVYRIIAIIILVPTFLYLASLLITALGILLQIGFFFVLFIIFGICLSITFRTIFFNDK